MILKQGLVLGGIGIAIGLVLSPLACRLVTSSTISVASFTDTSLSALFDAIALPLLLITIMGYLRPGAVRLADRPDAGSEGGTSL